MTKLQERLVDAYTTLVLGKRKTIDDVPADLRVAVETKVAEKIATI